MTDTSSSTERTGNVLSNRLRSLRRLVLEGIGTVGWVWFVVLGSGLILYGATASSLPQFWLLDWHVYYAGAIDLADHDLYRGELSVPGWTLPTPVFNLPPVSALAALPFALLGRGAGGVVWLFVGLGSLIVAAVLGARVIGRKAAWAWVGIALLVYTAYPDFASHVLLGNNNHLVLALLAAFAWAYLHDRPALAGALLGVAISIKLWPIAFFPLLLRGRSWATVAIACAVVFVLGAVMLVWLGIDSVPAMVSAVRSAVPTDERSPYIWTTWTRENWSWWPVWLAPVLGCALALLPVSGRAGIGLAVIGGVMLVNNIWSHYLPTIVLGLALAAVGIRERLQQVRQCRHRP